jgi:hypothetical protein
MGDYRKVKLLDANGQEMFLLVDASGNLKVKDQSQPSLEPVTLYLSHTQTVATAKTDELSTYTAAIGAYLPGKTLVITSTKAITVGLEVSWDHETWFKVYKNDGTGELTLSVGDAGKIALPLVIHAPYIRATYDNASGVNAVIDAHLLVVRQSNV